MRPLLPNLVPSEDQPSSAHDLDWTRDSENAAQLIQGLVRYPPESRIRASDLLRLAYFTQGRLPVLPSPHTDAEHSGPSSLEGEPGDLAQLISQLLDKSSDSG
jgi:serine/threonine protein kinase